jgi:hypothetical protein
MCYTQYSVAATIPFNRYHAMRSCLGFATGG